MNWYILAGYDDEWREEIELRARGKSYPFNSWFGGNNRIFLPFKVESTPSVDIPVNVNNELLGNGCQVVDSVNGLISCGSNRTQKIGKFLENLRNKKLKELMSYNYSEEELSLKTDEINNYYNSLLSEYSNSRNMSLKNYDNLYVAISQDPHDIGQMSTGRGWEQFSCMRFPTRENNQDAGEQYENVFCEVSEGGLIAYLVREGDVNISKPMSRLLIRRFENSDGKSYAIPENVVYGTEVPGFLDFVRKWLDSKQGSISSGYYELKGSEYSDSLDDYVLNLDFSDYSIEDLMDCYNGKCKNFENKKYTVVDQLYDEILYYDDEYAMDNVEDLSRSFSNRDDSYEYFDKMNSMSEDSEEHIRDMIYQKYGDEDWIEMDVDGWEIPRFSRKEENLVELKDLRKKVLERINSVGFDKFPKDFINKMYFNSDRDTKGEILKINPENFMNSQNLRGFINNPKFIYNIYKDTNDFGKSKILEILLKELETLEEFLKVETNHDNRSSSNDLHLKNTVSDGIGSFYELSEIYKNNVEEFSDELLSSIILKLGSIIELSSVFKDILPDEEIVTLWSIYFDFGGKVDYSKVKILKNNLSDSDSYFYHQFLNNMVTKVNNNNIYLPYLKLEKEKMEKEVKDFEDRLLERYGKIDKFNPKIHLMKKRIEKINNNIEHIEGIKKSSVGWYKKLF